MGNTTELDERISTRAPAWMVERIDAISESSGWANDSQVSRDMVEMGILHYELTHTDYVDIHESPVLEWERPQGAFPDDDLLVCPRCVNSNKYLFRLRQAPVAEDVEAMECLACGLFVEPENYIETLPDHYYWAKSGPHPHHHLMDDDARRSVCGTYNDSGMETRFAPGIHERPKHICTDCWHEHINWEE